MEDIRSINYWDAAPVLTGFKREQYVDQILSYQDSNLLKVLVGQRRSGKSTILKQTIAKLIDQGVHSGNILYLNFELYVLRHINNTEALARTVDLYFSTIKPQGKVYLFFDEIQEVEHWETLVNSYLADDRRDVEIFLTGSNAHLLSTELSTYVTGRYVEISVYPFSYAEYLVYKNLAATRSNLINYIESSGMPELYNLHSNQQKTAYLMALKDSILMNDIVKRFNIKNPKLLSMLLDFIIDNMGHLFSLNSIVKKLNATGVNLNVVTIGNYVHYLEQTFLVHSIPRYDLKGKRILEGERKYYLNDLAFSNYLQNTFDNGINKKLENYVFQTLLHAGFKVYVGNYYNVEIDFVAEKNQQILYIQVTYLLHSDEVVRREYGNLEKIANDWPKWVVSLDDVSIPPRQGIQHVPAWILHEKL